MLCRSALVVLVVSACFVLPTSTARAQQGKGEVTGTVWGLREKVKQSLGTPAVLHRNLEFLPGGKLLDSAIHDVTAVEADAYHTYRRHTLSWTKGAGGEAVWVKYYNRTKTHLEEFKARVVDGKLHVKIMWVNKENGAREDRGEKVFDPIPRSKTILGILKSRNIDPDDLY